MFVGVVIENFHKCRESQEKEEKARRAAKRALKLEKKRISESFSVISSFAMLYGVPQSLPDNDRNWVLTITS